MTLDEFTGTLDHTAPPAGLTPALRGLWHAARGEWDRAHGIVQDDGSREAAWVHAYLHREEGDQRNAGYWYLQAGKPAFDGSLEEEWREIVAGLLGET